jgi:hypothetical protein
VSTNAFGFMTIEQWKMVARDVHGMPMTTCMLRDTKVACTLIREP